MKAVCFGLARSPGGSDGGGIGRKIHPVVAERLPLSDARRAHELLASSASKGKLVPVP